MCQLPHEFNAGVLDVFMHDDYLDFGHLLRSLPYFLFIRISLISMTMNTTPTIPQPMNHRNMTNIPSGARMYMCFTPSVTAVKQPIHALHASALIR